MIARFFMGSTKRLRYLQMTQETTQIAGLEIISSFQNGDNETKIQNQVLPKEVETDSSSGVEERSLELATKFMECHGKLARKCFKRGELSQLYISTQESWMPEEIRAEVSEQRPFKQVLFALAHGLHLVRVTDSGRILKWNKFRNDRGEKITTESTSRYEKVAETEQYSRDGRPIGHPRRDRRDYDHRDRRDYDRRDRRDYDRRDRRDYDNRDRRDYDRRNRRDYDRRDRRDY